MLFSEVYGAYYAAVSAILREAIEGPVTSARIDQIVRKKAFAESVLTIGPALASGEWPLLTSDGRTPLRHIPEMPLTLLEKRWLKSLLLDPRIALFYPPAEGLEDVEPLFNPGDVHWFDQCLDGDPYSNPCYIARFRAALLALKEQRMLTIRFRSGAGQLIRGDYAPSHIEYSQKDDKFRLITLGGTRGTILFQSMLLCEPGEPIDPARFPDRTSPQVALSLLIADERNALERSLLHFSYFRKEVERATDGRFNMTLWYEPEDEVELVIRVLSFGPMVKVISPERFKRQIIERLDRQIELF